MKTIVIIISIFSLGQLNAQGLKTIYTNENKAVALFFPDEIQQAVVGSPNFTFSYNKENSQHIGLLQGVKGVESNLLVITNTDEVFSYVLKYRNHLDTLSYFIPRQERIGLEKPVSITVLENKVPIKIDSPPTKSPQTDSQNRLAYFKKFSEFHLKYNRNSLQRKQKNGIVLLLKDMIYDRTEVYVLIEIKNKSEIDLEMDYLKLFKVHGNKRKKSSYQKIALKPIYEHNLPKIIKVGGSCDFVLTVPKFTFGDTEKLLLELKEYRGNRLLQLLHD
jgi:hypothetical protein